MLDPLEQIVDVPAIDDQRRFWNDWDAHFRENQPLDPVSLKRCAKVLTWISSLNLGTRQILELGCANGWLSSQLANYGHVTGIDLADEVIARAKSRCPHIDFRAGDILTMDLGDGTFDLAVSLETISCLPDQEKFIDALARSLRSGGYLIMTTQNRFVFERLDSVAARAPGQIRKWVSRGELKALLRPRFRVLRMETIVPTGHRGVLRFINSYKLNAVWNFFGSPAQFEHIKEQVGFGQTIVVLARKAR